MSGLCGWLTAGGSGLAEPENRSLLERMAAPLQCFDQSALATAAGLDGAAAIAARPGSAHIHQQDGLLVAIWGQARLLAPEAVDCCPGTDIAARLAALWRSSGSGACAALSGSFALCILDQTAGEALLAIDRSGIHALSYTCDATGLYFASSLDALVIHPSVQTAIDPQALYNYLYFHMVPAPRTIYRNQQRLQPGE
jgi:asparagine synthase (glutamine-hydrolysing)